MKLADIFSASPAQRTNKVIAAYRSMAVDLDKLQDSMQVLNMWVMRLPEYINDNQAATPDQEELAEAIDVMFDSMRKLQAELSANVTATKNLEDVLLFNRKYGPSNETV